MAFHFVSTSVLIMKVLRRPPIRFDGSVYGGALTELERTSGKAQYDSNVVDVDNDSPSKKNKRVIYIKKRS